MGREKTAEPIELLFGILIAVGGTTWQIRFNDCASAAAESGSATRGCDTACTKIILGNLVI